MIIIIILKHNINTNTHYQLGSTSNSSNPNTNAALIGTLLGLAAPQTVTQAFGGSNSTSSSSSNTNNNLNNFLSNNNNAPLSPPSQIPQSPSSQLVNANIATYGGSNPSPAQMHLLNQLAIQLKVEGPVTSRLFVASIDFRVDELKLQEVFGMAGQISSISLFRDRDGKSRGMAVVEYDTPYEALNAVSMLNRQTLMDRQLSVRFDTKPPESLLSEPPELNGGGKGLMAPPKLPSGLKSIGSGLSLTSLPPPILNPSLTQSNHYNGMSNGNGLLSNPPLALADFNSFSQIGGGLNSFNGGGPNGSSLLGNSPNTSMSAYTTSQHHGYSNGKANSSSSSSHNTSGSLHVGSGGDIRIVSSSGNGGLSISNRIAGYSNSGGSSGNNNSSSSSSHHHTSSSSSNSRSNSNYSTSKSHSSKVFVKNVSV
jgi:hypothetical protein